MTILETALNRMPKRFSSNEFCTYVEKNGFSRRRINNGDIASFLHNNCTQITRRTWEKIDYKKEINYINKTLNKIEHKSNEVTEDECIKYLKERGYRIQKIEYKEI